MGDGRLIAFFSEIVVVIGPLSGVFWAPPRWEVANMMHFMGWLVAGWWALVGISALEGYRCL